MSEAVAAVAKCPRCGGELIRNHDELLCMVHGTVHTPSRAWDLASERFNADETAEAGGRRRGPQGYGSKLAWTDEERRTWETWREGDPVDGEKGEQMFEVQSSAQLGAACVARIKELAGVAAELRRKLDGLQVEAAKLAAVARLCEVEIPDLPTLLRPSTSKTRPGAEYQVCPECGRRFQIPYGIAVHRRKAHGVAGTS